MGLTQATDKVREIDIQTRWIGICVAALVAVAPPRSGRPRRRAGTADHARCAGRSSWFRATCSRWRPRGGETLAIELTPEARVYVAKPGSLEDISEGSQIGVTSVEGETEGVENLPLHNRDARAAPPGSLM
jgi:hypothetical protein